MGIYIISYVCRSVEFEIDYIPCNPLPRYAARGNTQRERSFSKKTHFLIHESLADSALFNTRDS